MAIVMKIAFNRFRRRGLCGPLGANSMLEVGDSCHGTHGVSGSEEHRAMCKWPGPGFCGCARHIPQASKALVTGFSRRTVTPTDNLKGTTLRNSRGEDRRIKCVTYTDCSQRDDLWACLGVFHRLHCVYFQTVGWFNLMDLLNSELQFVSFSMILHGDS